MDKTRTTLELIDDEIRYELDAIGTFDDGSEQKKVAIEHLSKLYELKLKETKQESELTSETEKEEQKKAEALDKIIRYGLGIFEIVVPLMAYGHWYRQGLRFEQTNTVGDPFVRNLVNKMSFKKR